QRGQIVAAMHRVEGAGDDGQGRTQLMRGVGGELSLHGKAALEAVERAIDGADERLDLAWKILVRQANRHHLRADRRGAARDLLDRLEAAADPEISNPERGGPEKPDNPGRVR